MIERALNVYEVLRQEYERLHDPLPPDNVDWDRLSKQEEAAKVAELLPGLNAKIHAAERTALCFSGGGIRSATFALGVIQRLAAIGLLPKFDFLSTVSGGGYIGSWLSSYIRRTPTGVAGVSQQLASTPATPLEPRDVYNYAQTSQTFPHETTGDQWFSESQFESYRALGYFALSRIVADQHLAGIADFITKAEANLDAQTVQQEAVPGETI